MDTEIDSLLKPYQRFGIDLGLERIKNLLSNLGNPQTQVPIVHVGGTNGKGSVCAYLSAILTEAGYRVGRYTSPHLVNWNERICLNGRPITDRQLSRVLSAIEKAIEPHGESPTQFEVITAAAWLYFAQAQVDIAIMEVGLGGRLDATNVCDRPLVSVITSISMEHWQRLGPTLRDIAREKAGILKSHCPAAIGPLPPEARQVVAARACQLDCPTTWVNPAQKLTNSEGTTHWAACEGIEYPLSLAGEIQLLNSAIAIATVNILRARGWQVSTEAIQGGMGKTRWRGRIEWLNWRQRKILVDGAHNTAAAGVLREYVDSCGPQPVQWVMGMLATKDSRGILSALLKPGDELYLVPVPEHATANPEELASSAAEICPRLAKIETHPHLFSALHRATNHKSKPDRLLVICGSLYLIGHFFERSDNVVMNFKEWDDA